MIDRHFTIPMIPRTKKNSQRILINHRTRRPFIAPSLEYERYQNKVAYFLPMPRLKIDTPVTITCHFYMPTKRRVDLTNLLECIDDCLVRYNTITDDSFNIIASHDGSRVFVDKENPRTEIWIKDFQE